jgi:hypothetical protein
MILLHLNVANSVLKGMLQVEKDAGIKVQITFVYLIPYTARKVAVSLQYEVYAGSKQRVPGQIKAASCCP